MTETRLDETERTEFETRGPSLTEPLPLPEGRGGGHETRRAIQTQIRSIGIGTIRLLSDDGRGGLILQFDTKEEAYFRIEDVESKDVGRGYLKGRIVQYAKEQTDIGVRAREIVVLDQSS